MRIDTAMIRLLALVLVTWLWLGPGAPPPAHAAMEDGALTLKKAGKAPRKRLALALIVGSKGHVSLSNEASIAGGPGGDVKRRTITTGIDWRIVSGDAKGGWVYELVVELPAAPEAATPAAGSKTQIGPGSLTLRGTVSADGAMTFDGKRGDNPGGTFTTMLLTELANNALRLPKEPVGVGASWQTVQTSMVLGKKSVNTTTTTVTRMTRGGFEGKTKSLVGTGGGGTTAKGKSTATLTWDAAQLYPAAMVTDSKTVTTATVGGEVKTMTMTLHTEQTATPAP